MVCRVERQAGWLGVLGWEAAGGVLQLWAELGSLGHLSLLLPFQLPLPLTELMENEALEILTKALQSEPSSHKRPWRISQGLGPWDWGFRMCLSCQILLPPTNIPGVPQKMKNWGLGAERPSWEIMGLSARGLGSSLIAAPL